MALLDEEETGAAFGFFPQMQPRRRLQDVQGSANLPVDVTRGRLAGLLGLIPDVLNFMGRSPMPTETFGETQYNPRPQLPYDTDFYLKNLPLAPTSRAGQVAGQAASFVPLNPAPAARALGAGAKALGPTAANMTEGYLQRQGLIMPLDVYHGTPHTLPPTARNPLGEFDASKIGTGEGAQAYGYGTYTAENPAVAKAYQFMEQNWFDTSKAKYKGKSIDSWYEQAQKDQERAFRTKDKALEKDATARLAYWENVMTHNHPESVVKQFADPAYGWPEATNYAKSIDLGKFSGIPRSGNLYKVDLPDAMIPKMLDWDKPLSQQDVIRTLNPRLVNDSTMFDKAFSMEAVIPIGNGNKRIAPITKTYASPEEAQAALDKMTGADLYNFLSKTPMPSGASDFLRQAGIPGIKYLDEGSRAKGEGTRNFVTFPGEEKNLRILERNGLLGD